MVNCLVRRTPVSYTHLDVYKRQPLPFVVLHMALALRECSRCIPRMWRRLRSSAAAVFVAPSCTTCVIALVKRLRSKRKLDKRFRLELQKDRLLWGRSFCPLWMARIGNAFRKYFLDSRTKSMEGKSRFFPMFPHICAKLKWV